MAFNVLFDGLIEGKHAPIESFSVDHFTLHSIVYTFMMYMPQTLMYMCVCIVRIYCW